MNFAPLPDDWPVDGFVSGEYLLKGNYETQVGTGNLLIEDGVAYGETFDRATAALRFEGTGVRLEKFEVRKSTGAPGGASGAAGTMTGAAWIGWDGNYSFTADGERIPVESLASVQFPTAPLSGLIGFKASGTGTFEEPHYDVTFAVADLFAGEEGIGQVTGHLALRGELLTTDFEAASNTYGSMHLDRVDGGRHGVARPDAQHTKVERLSFFPGQARAQHRRYVLAKQRIAELERSRTADQHMVGAPRPRATAGGNSPAKNSVA